MSDLLFMHRIWLPMCLGGGLMSYGFTFGIWWGALGALGFIATMAAIRWYYFTVWQPRRVIEGLAAESLKKQDELERSLQESASRPDLL